MAQRREAAECSLDRHRDCSEVLELLPAVDAKAVVFHSDEKIPIGGKSSPAWSLRSGQLGLPYSFALLGDWEHDVQCLRAQKEPRVFSGHKDLLQESLAGRPILYQRFLNLPGGLPLPRDLVADNLPGGDAAGHVAAG